MKNKALTFSYDDGTTQDVRLAGIFGKYNLKATFNLNSELLGLDGKLDREGKIINHTKVNAADVRHIYDGHEVAVHTLTHPNLTQIADELVGYEVMGMAYPCGGVNCNDRVADIIKANTPIKYSRTIDVTKSFEPYEDLYQYKGTLYHHGNWDELFSMGEAFLKLETDTPKVFYIWGHSFEFDIYPERWEIFEEFCRMMSGKDDIFYGTNLEVLCGNWR